MIDSNIIRQAAERRRAAKIQHEPSAWRILLDCNHAVVMTREEIRNAHVDSHFDGLHASQDTIVCPRCSRGEPASCEKTVIHRVVDATPLFAGHYSKQRAQQQQPSQEQEPEEEQQQET